MRYVITPDTMRDIEQMAFANGLSSNLLMERAARHIAKAALSITRTGRILVLCGPGNNGGDGLAAARILAGTGMEIDVYLADNLRDPPPDALENMIKWIQIAPFTRYPGANGPYSLIIDALLGIGLTGKPRSGISMLIEWINRQKCPVLAVDIPSGVNALDGSAPGSAVRAAKTVTFHAAKLGHVLFPGRELCGEIEIADIGLDGNAFNPERDCTLFDESDVAALLPPRPINSHKGTFGHALLIAGSRGMAGAAAMAAKGALLAGAGLVTVACPERSVLPIVQTLTPEAMACPLPENENGLTREAAQAIPALCRGKRAIAIGPGLGTGAPARNMLLAALSGNLPIVLDADALNLLAAEPALWNRVHRSTILTPHPGEMERLLPGPGSPLEKAQELTRRYDVVTLLKGASTIITVSGKTHFNINGTPAMARGGSGDVLTGVIAALLAQGLTCYDAARLGAYLHARAGERAQKKHRLAFTPMQMAQYL